MMMSRTHSQSNGAITLKQWWKNLKLRPSPDQARAIFSTSLDSSLSVASTLASLKAFPEIKVNVPTPVYICVQYLREHGRDIQGVFRVSGSLKRIQDLQNLLKVGPSFGKDQDLMTLGFTTHDVAGVLTRYLNSLADTVIPTNLFKDFRSLFNLDEPNDYKIEEFKKLILQISSSHSDLLVYLLDFLGEFSSYSNATLMPSSNLAAVFQPSILSLPEHSLQPEEYKISQQVVEFLISNYLPFAQNASLSNKLNLSHPLSQARPRSIKRRVTMSSSSSLFRSSTTSNYSLKDLSLTTGTSQTPLPKLIPESMNSKPLSRSIKSKRFSFF